MSPVIQLGDYKGKETVAVLRELLVLATKGKIGALGFNVEFTDGKQKSGFTGRYKFDPAEALKAANRMSQRLNAIRDVRDAAGIADDQKGAFGPRVVKLRKL